VLRAGAQHARGRGAPARARARRVRRGRGHAAARPRAALQPHAAGGSHAARATRPAHRRRPRGLGLRARAARRAARGQGDRLSASLTPASYVQGLQCALRLWLAAREPGGGEAETGRASPGEWSELRAGLRELHPQAGQAQGSAARTRELIAAGAPLLLDAVFEHGGVRLAVELLERGAGERWRAALLVADERARDADRERAALTAFALRGSGLRADRIELWLPDPGFARGAGPLDWKAFFRRVDATRDAELLAEDAPGDVRRLAALVGDAPRPEIEPSPHCFRPTRCPYRADCARPFGPDWIGNLPRLRPELDHALRERGVQRISAIPDDVALAREQRAARSAARSGGSWVSPDLAKALSSCGPPVAFLDFEAIAPAVPLYPGTRPFQVIPVQWSLRALDGAGRVQQHAFLAEGNADPRPALAAALLEVAGPPELPIAVYSSFESEVLADLAAALPARGERLMRLRARLRDLQAILRAHAYRSEQRGAYGLKRALPAFVPELDWRDLEIASGAAAAETWLALARGELEPGDAERARRELASYCARDTEALDALLSALRRLSQAAMRK
jgi:hypothetical protein